jgi:hypothetical protein
MIVSVGHSLTRTFGIHHLRVDPLLVWNANILQPLLDFRKGLMREQLDILDNSNMLIMLIQGFCGVMPVGGMGAIGQSVNLGLISRLGWKRAGARFRTRGVDDEGNVANFVEVRLSFRRRTFFSSNDKWRSTDGNAAVDARYMYELRTGQG